MRLFIGITLPPKLKDKLAPYETTLKSGKSVSKTNYHITLVYLGETSETKKDMVDRSLKTLIPSFSPFEVSVSTLNTFKKGTTHIVYADVIKTDALDTIQTSVESLMTSLGFSCDTRAYNPHITLARKVKEPPQKHRIDDTFTVDTITLFLSHRVDDVLTYTPIETYPLKGSHDTPTIL